PPTTSDESTPPRPDTPIHRNTLLMPLSDYIYCKIFVAKASEQEVREIASSALGAYFQGKFLEVSDILVEVSRNPDSHGDRNFDEDFIYWPTLIELELKNHSHFPILARKTSLLLSTLWGNTASLGCLAWSWLEAMDDDGVQESGRCWFGVFSGLETVVGPTAFAGRAPARSGPHPGPGELSDRARPHPCQVLRGKKPRRSTTPSGERNWWRP